MFVWWGSARKLAEVGPAGLRHCGHCDKDAHFTGMVEYSVRHIYGIFRWVTDRVPYTICGNCGGAHAADPEAYDSGETRKAIPLWDRRGWLLGAGGIGAIVASVSIAAAADHSLDKTFVAAPRAGDRYEADLARIMAHPEAERMYSVIRVTRVSADGVEVELGRRYYNDWRGVDRDLREGQADSEAYYGPERVALPQASIQKMFDDGTIRDVQR